MVCFYFMTIAGPVHAAGDEDTLELESHFSPTNAFSMGLEIATAISEQIELVDDEEITQRVNDIGYKVAYWASDPEINFSYNVIKIKEPNAFALPGGFIFITEGMMKIGLTDDELAMLLGHESAHVKQNHFAKMQRRSGLLTMLQQLLIIGTIIGMQDSSSSRQIYDPRRQDEYQISGKAAVVNGLLTFGSLFKNLLELGYSRKYEHEADQLGFHYAVQAGYDPDAIVGLMQKLHNHIYEMPGIGYWRTHPYFYDRLERAEIRARIAEKPENKSDPALFRQQSQNGFLLAKNTINKKTINNKEQKIFLDKLAFQAAPKGKYIDKILDNMLTALRLREEDKPVIHRDFGTLLKHYNLALKQLETGEKGSGEIYENMTSERDRLEKERTSLLPRYLEILDRGDNNTEILKTFISNYPKHERVRDVYIRLAENYRLQGDTKEAIKSLIKAKDIISIEGNAKEKINEQIALLIPEIKEPALCLELLEIASDEDRKELEKQMEIVIEKHLTLENINTVLNQWPDSEYTPRIQLALDKTVEQEYNLGRILEAARDYQKALDVYNSIDMYAAQTKFGQLAKDRIDFIQRLEEK